jgi:16S rRNA (adenine1518-N6/adenine1519-N6)-dimethyltransferase
VKWLKPNEINSMSKFAAPRKSLGQNFLQDPNIINKIVAGLGIGKDDIVVEIGPGRGALTDLIIPQAGHTHLIEFDRDLVVYWQDRADSNDNLTVHGVDVMRFDLHEIIRTSERKIKVIGNLPYNISSPVLFHLMHYAEHIEHQIVMLQKEVVERMASGPGSRQYGRLSVMLQQRYQIENLFKVPPAAFFPAPKVDSAIARLTPLTSVPFPVTSQSDFEKIVKQAFSMRRKTLRNTLKGSVNSDQIESLGIDPSARAETLSVSDFSALSNLYTALPETA